MKRQMLVLIAVIALALSISAAVLHMALSNSTNSSSESQEDRTFDYIGVKDVVGRSVKVKKYPERVVAIGPGALRLIAYLNATDLVVGVEEIETSWSPLGRDYAMAYRDVFKRLPVIGPGGPRSPPDPEKIISVRPDLVLMSRIYVELYDPDRLSTEVNAPVLVVDYGDLDLENVKSVLRMLGKVLGRENRAEELCKYIDSIIRDLRDRVRGVEGKPLVYVGAISYRGAQPFTSSQARFLPLVLLNTSSIVDEVSQKPGFISIEFEYLISKQPEIVFIDANNLNIVIDDFNKDKEKYCSLVAFEKGNVYSIMPFNYYYTNLAIALADAYYMGKVLYPERFTDVDPVAKSNEIFSVFLGAKLHEQLAEGFNVGFQQLSYIFRCNP